MSAAAVSPQPEADTTSFLRLAIRFPSACSHGGGVGRWRPLPAPGIRLKCALADPGRAPKRCIGHEQGTRERPGERWRHVGAVSVSATARSVGPTSCCDACGGRGLAWWSTHLYWRLLTCGALLYLIKQPNRSFKTFCTRTLNSEFCFTSYQVYH